MRIRILLLILVGLFVSAIGFAQTNGETPSAPELQLSATQNSVNETATAEAFNGTATPTDIPDPFVLTADALVINATQTGQASGFTPVSITEESVRFDLTATQLLLEATATTQANIALSVTDEVEDTQALNITILAIGLVIFVLIIIGGGYIVLNSRDEQNLKP